MCSKMCSKFQRTTSNTATIGECSTCFDNLGSRTGHDSDCDVNRASSKAKCDTWVLVEPEQRTALLHRPNGRCGDREWHDSGDRLRLSLAHSCPKASETNSLAAMCNCIGLEKSARSAGLTEADSGFCPYCNPSAGHRKTYSIGDSNSGAVTSWRTPCDFVSSKTFPLSAQRCRELMSSLAHIGRTLQVT